jgi:hypothetical protein
MITIRMPAVRPEQLVGGEQYYIRHTDTFLGPFDGDVGLLPFTYDDSYWFHLTTDPSAIFDAYDEHWEFFPMADGPPVNPVLLVPPAPRQVPLPYGGRLVVSNGARNVVSMTNIAEGDQLVNWNMNADPQGRRESNFGHYYSMNTYNQLPDPKISPTTRARINTKNPRRYTASLRVVNTAFPKGSANAGLFDRTRSKRKRKAKSRKNKLTQRN